MQDSYIKKYQLGIKLVRGAYIVSETAEAAKLNYKNPIWSGIQLTHANYNACAARLVDLVKVGGVKVSVL